MAASMPAPALQRPPARWPRRVAAGAAAYAALATVLTLLQTTMLGLRGASVVLIVFTFNALVSVLIGTTIDVGQAAASRLLALERRGAIARLVVHVAVVGLAVALASLRLAVRSDDAVLVELGARRRTLAAIHAWRAAAVASGAALLGAAIGLASTAIGVWHYDHRSRIQEDVELLPLGWQVPNLVWLAIVVVPLLAAAIGGALAALGPPPSAGRTRIDGA